MESSESIVSILIGLLGWRMLDLRSSTGGNTTTTSGHTDHWARSHRLCSHVRRLDMLNFPHQTWL